MWPHLHHSVNPSVASKIGQRMLSFCPWIWYNQMFQRSEVWKNFGNDVSIRRCIVSIWNGRSSQRQHLHRWRSSRPLLRRVLWFAFDFVCSITCHFLYASHFRFCRFKLRPVDFVEMAGVGISKHFQGPVGFFRDSNEHFTKKHGLSGFRWHRWANDGDFGLAASGDSSICSFWLDASELVRLCRKRTKWHWRSLLRIDRLRGIIVRFGKPRSGKTSHGESIEFSERWLHLFGAWNRFAHDLFERCHTCRSFGGCQFEAWATLLLFRSASHDWYRYSTATLRCLLAAPVESVGI